MLTPGPWDGSHGRVQQRGSGGYTLCEPCNNKTGRWYGAEYASWAAQGLERLQRIPPTEEQRLFIPFRGRPVRFLKQAITMLFSVNTEKFARIHPELVTFVLDWRATGLPPRYKVELVLVRGGFARSSGVFGAVDLAGGQSEIACEVAHFPFAVRLVLGDVSSERRGAIEHFAQFGPDEHREVWVYTVAGFVATKFPGDYRSRERVEREAKESLEDEVV